MTNYKYSGLNRWKLFSWVLKNSKGVVVLMHIIEELLVTCITRMRSTLKVFFGHIYIYICITIICQELFFALEVELTCEINRPIVWPLNHSASLLIVNHNLSLLNCVLHQFYKSME